MFKLNPVLNQLILINGWIWQKKLEVIADEGKEMRTFNEGVAKGSEHPEDHKSKSSSKNQEEMMKLGRKEKLKIQIGNQINIGGKIVMQVNSLVKKRLDNQIEEYWKTKPEEKKLENPGIS